VLEQTEGASNAFGGGYVRPLRAGAGAAAGARHNVAPRLFVWLRWSKSGARNCAQRARTDVNCT